MKRFSLSSLRFFLLLLVLFAVIPVLGLTFYSGLENYQMATSQAKEDALRLARLVSSSHLKLIEGTHQFLHIVAQLQQVRDLDAPACSSLFANLLKQNPQYLNIGAADLNGNLFASAIPLTQPINIADRLYFRQTLKTHKFAIGEHQIGRIHGKPSVNFGYPIFNETGRIKAVIYASLDLEWINQLSSQAELPKGSTVILIDKQGKILVCYHESGKWVGKTIAEETIVKTILSQKEGMTEALGVDGVPRLYGFTSLGQPYGSIHVGIGIPKEITFAETRRILTRNLSLLAMVTFLALTVAWLFGSLYIMRPVKQLLEATRQLGDGNLTVRVGPLYDLGEIGQLSHAFDQMAESLKSRETERKRSEEAFRESEDRYRDLVEYSQYLICTHDLRGQILYVNQEGARLLGYDQRDLLNKNIRDLLALEFRDEFDTYLDTIQKQGAAKGFMLLLTATGEKRVWEYNNTLRTEGVTVPIVRAIAHDVTERLRAEKAVTRLSQENAIMAEIGRIISSTLNIEEVYERFAEEVRKLISFDRISINVLNHEKRTFTIAYINGLDVGDRRMGDVIPLAATATEEVFRTQSSLLIQAEDLQEITSPFPGLLSSLQVGLLSTMSVPLISKDQVIGVLHVQSLKPNAYTELNLKLAERVGTQIAGAIANAELFAERNQAEEALRESEKRFRELYDNAPVGYHEYDKEGCITHVNRTELEMLGYTAEEMLGQPVWNFIVEKESQERVKAKLTGDTSPVRTFERTYRKKDGSTFPVLIEDRLLRDSEGRVTGIRSTIQDITERKRIEKEMATLEEQLRQSQKIEAIGRLAGGIAHDFNNLLTVIKGYSRLSLIELKEGDPLRENIEEIQRASERATDLTRQLLAFSRRQILDFKVLNLNTLLRDLDKMLCRILGEDIELVILLAEDLGQVKTDPGQIEQLIMNLSVNARDAMTSGGKLTIETANMELSEEYARAHIGVTPGHYVMLSVSDTGVGMSPEIKENIFEPFFTTKEKGKGTGLGLSTVYGIVKQSGGNIWVYSEPGQGTTFKIYFPRVEGEERALHHRETTGPLLQGKETILLVEDETSVRGFAARVLHDHGYTLLEAVNGDEALRLAQEHAGEEIHLLLTDVVMPKMGGKELADQLKILWPDIRVLFTSGYTDNAIVQHGVLNPGIHFLQKPFSPEALARKVREVLERE